MKSLCTKWHVSHTLPQLISIHSRLQPIIKPQPLIRFTRLLQIRLRILLADKMCMTPPHNPIKLATRTNIRHNSLALILQTNIQTSSFLGAASCENALDDRVRAQPSFLLGFGEGVLDEL